MKKDQKNPILLIVVAIIAIALVIATCFLISSLFKNSNNNNDDSPNNSTSESNGDHYMHSETYYYYADGQTDKSTWVTINSNYTWSSSDGLEGNYTYENGYLNLSLYDLEENVLTAKIVAGVLSITTNPSSNTWTLFYLDGKAPDSDDKGESSSTSSELDETTEAIIIHAPSEGLNYRLNDDGEGYTVIGFGEFRDRNLVIPSTYKDLPITIIGENAFKYSWSSGIKINSVTIPDTVSVIQSGAFSEQNLTNIYWGAGIIEIGEEAFYNCDNLSTLDIPNSITKIGDSAFYDCDNLKTITLSNSIATIGQKAFSSCNELTSVSFGDGIETIKCNAFEECSKLTEVKINSIESWCKITFEVDKYGATNYSSNPLYYAHHLYLSNGERVTSIALPDSITQLGVALAYSTINSITFSSKLEIIDDYAFMGCTQLKEVDLGTNIKHIGKYAFANCSSLEKIIIPDSVTFLGGEDSQYYYADKTVFTNCSNLTYVKFGLGIKKLGSYFSECTNLTSIEIPYGITEIIGLYEGTAVEYVTIPGSAKEFSGFYNTMVKEIILEEGIRSIGWRAFEGAIITKITIPSSVTLIEDDAFLSCENGLEVYLASPKITIESNAFQRCDNLKLFLPSNSQIDLSINAFNNANDVEIHINDLADWYNIKFNKEFIGYPNNNNITLFCNGDSIKSITIPQGTNTIASYTFINQFSLTSVNIPKSVTKIGTAAFYGCKNLTNIFYEGTMKDWKNINFDLDWRYKVGSLTIHCSDGSWIYG